MKAHPLFGQGIRIHPVSGPGHAWSYDTVPDHHRRGEDGIRVNMITKADRWLLPVIVWLTYVWVDDQVHSQGRLNIGCQHHWHDLWLNLEAAHLVWWSLYQESREIGQLGWFTWTNRCWHLPVLGFFKRTMCGLASLAMMKGPVHWGWTLWPWPVGVLSRYT